MDASAIAWVLILSVTALAICISNLCIFYAVYKSKKLQNRGNVFILCLASSDFLVSIFNVPFAAVSVAYPSLRQSGSTLCDISGFFEMTFLIASVFSVTAINVHRYIYIVFWTKYHEILRNKKICIMISCLWLSAIILSAPPLLNLSKIAFKSGKSHCFVDWKATPGYTFSLILICFLMPIVVMGFCYYKIYMFRQESRKILKNRLPSSVKGSNSKNLVTDNCEAERESIDDNADPKNDQYRKSRTSQAIADFLNESINVPGEHLQIEMRDLSSTESIEVGDEEELSDTVEHYGKPHEKIDDCSEKNGPDTQTTTAVMHSRGLSGEQLKQSSQQQHRRTRKLSLTHEEQTYVPKCSNLSGSNEGNISMQKHLGKNDRSKKLPCHRNIEILVEESVTSTVDSMHVKDTEYKFQVCSAEVTESHEKYVVKRTKKSKEDFRLTMMCVIIVAAFFASWFPFVVTMVIESLTTIKIPSAVDKATLLIGYLNSLSNPIIYCYFNKNFRIQLKKLICKKRMRRARLAQLQKSRIKRS